MTTSTYRLDQTHMGLRLTLLGIFFVSLAIGIIAAIPLVINVARVPSPFNVLAVPALGAGIALGVSWGAERVLTRRWHSGRTLEVSEQGVTLNDRNGEPTTIAWDKRINVMAWHFKIRRGRAWVPKGFYCVACQLQQDEATIISYAFFKPAEAEAWSDWKDFPELLSRKEPDKSKKKKEPALSEVGGQAQLRYAERDRWRVGAEMAPADFIKLLNEIRQHVPDWQVPE